MRRTGALLVLLALVLAGCAPGKQVYETVFLDVFDTVTTLRGYDVSQQAFQARAEQVAEKYEAVRRERNRLESSGVPASDALNAMLESKGSAPVAGSARLADLLRRPEVSYNDIIPFDAASPGLPQAVTEEVEIQVKYAGYLLRQERQVEEFKKEEARLLPPELDYDAIHGLRLEARQKLSQIRPLSIGQAGRISGVSPADIAVLLIYLEQR